MLGLEIFQSNKNTTTNRYSSDLSNMIDNKKLIGAGSRYEILIRAATVIGVEKLKEKIKQLKNIDLKSIEIDWYLWNRGEQLNEKGKIQNHHRTLTTYY